MPDVKHPHFRETEPLPRAKPELSSCQATIKSSLFQAARQWVKAAILSAAAFLLCQCHRQPSVSSPTPTPTPASTATPIPSTSPSATPTMTPTAVPTATPPPAQPTPTPTPDPFKEGIQHLLETSKNGFLEL